MGDTGKQELHDPLVGRAARLLSCRRVMAAGRGCGCGGGFGRGRGRGRCLATGRILGRHPVGVGSDAVVRLRGRRAAGSGPERLQAVLDRCERCPQDIGPGGAFVGNAFIELSVHGHHTDRGRRCAACDLPTGCHHGDAGDFGRVLTRVAVREHPTVGEADQNHPVTVDGIVLFEMGDEGPQPSDVVDMLGGGLPAAGAGVPRFVQTIGIGHGDAGTGGEGIDAPLRLGFATVVRNAVQRDDERKGPRGCGRRQGEAQLRRSP